MTRIFTLELLCVSVLVVCVFISISSVRAGIIDDFPILSIRNNTHLLPGSDPFFETSMDSSFMIGQIDYSQGQPIWVWQEVFKNIEVEPGMIDELPFHPQHQIDDQYDLVFSFQAQMLSNDVPVGNAYAFKEGVEPPEIEPVGGVIDELPLADPRPTPIVMFSYASPPTEVGTGSIRLASNIGVVAPVDKLGLLAPYIGLASAVMAVTAASIIHISHRKEKQ